MRSLSRNCKECSPGRRVKIARPRQEASGFALLTAVVAAWGSRGRPGDLDGNGIVDLEDLLMGLDALGRPR